MKESHTPTAIAIDIGGTTIKGLSATTRGELRTRAVLPTPREGVDVFAAVVDLIDALRTGLEGLSGIGIASPGHVDTDHGVVRFAANLGWRDFPLVSALTARYGVQVSLENDARSGAIAERAGDPERNFAFVPIGTGVSAALLTDGTVTRGALGAAGEFGHLTVVPGGEPCPCGSRGCIEAYSSAASVLARFRRSGGHAETTPQMLALLGSDPLADRVWSEAVQVLARGLAMLVTLVDPGRIVLGGGLSLSGQTLLAPVQTAVAEQLTWRTAPPISSSTHGADSALLGAAVNAGVVGADALRRLASDLETSVLA